MGDSSSLFGSRKGRPRKEGKVGTSLSVRVKADAKSKRKPLEHHERKERPPPPRDVHSLPENPAFVGISVSVGIKTEYAAESIDVAAWCTLPCDITPEAREDAYEECRHIALEEAGRTLDAAAEKFFPDLVREPDRQLE